MVQPASAEDKGVSNAKRGEEMMATYLESSLMPGEEVRHRGRLHWVIFLLPGIAAAVILPFALVAVPFLFPIAFLPVLPPLIQRWTTEMAITNKRIVFKTGLIRRRTVEINLGKVETIAVDQSVVGRLLGFGTITVIGTGGTKEPFSMVAEPLNFRQQFNQLSTGA